MNISTTFRNILEEECLNFGNDIAISFENDEKKTVAKTFKELKSDVIAFGNYIAAQALPRKRIGIIAQNCYEHMITLAACMCGAGVFVPIDYNDNSEAMMHKIVTTEIDIVVFDRLAYDKLVEIQTGIVKVKKLVAIDEIGKDDRGLAADGFPRKNNAGYNFADSNPDDLRVIITSSGTSHEYHKHVMLSANNLLISMFCFNEVMVYERNLQVMLALPFTHVYAIYASLDFVLTRGCEMFISQGMHRIEHDMLKQNPGLVFLVPAVAQALYNKYNLVKERRGEADKKAVWGSRCEHIILAGSLVPEQLIRDYFALGIKMARGYGLSEAGALVSFAIPITDLTDDCKTVGVPLKCNEVKIVDDEILIRGPSVMLGYLGDRGAEMTQNIIVDGWLKTGDRGYLSDGDKLYVNGRMTSMIPLSSGKNIIPEELEDYFSRFDGVEECVVFSPDFINLYLMVYSGEAPFRFKAIEVLLQTANLELPLFQQVRKILVSDIPFEKTAIGKIKRSNLADQLNYLEIINKIRDIIANRMYADTIIRSNSNFKEELGISSYELVSFWGEIGDKFERIIPQKLFFKMNSLTNICDYLCDRQMKN